MRILSIFIVALGVVFLSTSLKPAIKICKQNRSIGWKLLLVLILFFLLGYLAFLYYLSVIILASIVETFLATILFGGSIFVFMVIKFSLASLEELKLIANKERHNALHDSLTGLPNRLHFMNEVSVKVNQALPFSIFVLDLNDFKPINDVVGHYYGDQLLIQLSRRMRNILPQDCFISRVGGDEFILITDAVTTADIEALTGLITEALANPFNINDYNMNVGVSIGISLFPTHARDIAPLLQKADTAMYASKKKQLIYKLYDVDLDDDAQARLMISSQLNSALVLEQFKVFYQPIVKEATTKVLHLEALLRWPQVDGSYIPPDQFIPVAEQSGLIRRITYWALTQIVDDLGLLAKQGIEACVHINLSVRDLQDNALSLQLAELIRAGKLSPAQLVLEVTETAIMADVKQTREVLSELSLQGFTISLDDFGTGYYV